MNAESSASGTSSQSAAQIAHPHSLQIKAADEAILRVSAAICNNIRSLSADPGLLAQNALSVCRTLTETLAVRYYVQYQGSKPHSKTKPKSQPKIQGRYETIQAALTLIRDPKNVSRAVREHCKMITEFHALLQISTSHYVQDPESSSRLMCRYLDYLYELRALAQADFNLEILGNLEDFPLLQDEHDRAYYEAVAGEIARTKAPGEPSRPERARFYILSKRPFFVQGRRYYEIHYVTCSGRGVKNERRTAFTALEICDYHAVKLSLHQGTVTLFGRSCGIEIISAFQIAIRPAELSAFTAVMTGFSPSISYTHPAYRALMDLLTTRRCSLRDTVAESTDDEFAQFLATTGLDTLPELCRALTAARKLIRSRKSGAQVISYLLLRLRHEVIQAQLNYLYDEDYRQRRLLGNEQISGLYLKSGCLPFDTMPLCTSLPGHNPPTEDLSCTVDIAGHESELLAKALYTKTIRERQIFHDQSAIAEDLGIPQSELEERLNAYNEALYPGHAPKRTIKKFGRYLYLNGVATTCEDIFKSLQEYALDGLEEWCAGVESRLDALHLQISDEQRQALLGLFAGTRVKLIYGAAGTGKTTLMQGAAALLSAYPKLFLAVTHTAVDNLKRRISAADCTFMTVEKALSPNLDETVLHSEVLFIDECGCLGNADMQKLLRRFHAKALILSGDEYQIEPIKFGNWFALAHIFLPDRCQSTLTTIFRATDPELLKLWSAVRKKEPGALELLEANGRSGALDQSLFERQSTDEIILCLGYDGVYGINCINRYLQEANPGREYRLGVNSYRTGDPVIFNDSKRFAPLLYNNLKGAIADIAVQDGGLYFTIDTAIPLQHDLDGLPEGLQLQTFEDTDGRSRTRVGFLVREAADAEQDLNELECEVPFQVAYAISVHKAQGLEYDSVKLIVSDHLVSGITLNLFYTAITRSRHYLKIYWSRKAEQQVFKQLQERDFGRDINLLSHLFPTLKKQGIRPRA